MSPHPLLPFSLIPVDQGVERRLTHNSPPPADDREIPRTHPNSIISALSLPADKVSILELDNASNGGDVQSYLAEKTGQRTVPNIFINGKHIGGCDDITRLNQSGELKKLVA